MSWVRVWDISIFSFEAHSRLSNFLLSSFLTSFSTPLRDAYIAHQPCDLEPPLYQLSFVLPSPYETAPAMTKEVTPIPLRLCGHNGWTGVSREGDGALVTDGREEQVRTCISGVFGVQIYTCIAPLTDDDDDGGRREHGGKGKKNRVSRYTRQRTERVR